MVFAVSRGSGGEVTEADFFRATEILLNAESKMSRIFAGAGRAQLGAVTDQIMDFMLRHGDSNRQQILRAFYKDVDAQSLDLIEATLQHMGFCKVIQRTGSRNKDYILMEKWE